MKLIVFIYSLFNGPYVLIANIALEILQGYMNMDKEIKEDNETTWKFVMFLVASAWLACFLLYNEPSVVILNGHIIRAFYVLAALDIEDGSPYVAFILLGLEFRNISDNDDQALIVRLLLLLSNFIVYTWLTKDFFTLVKTKYIYNNDLLPGSFIKAIISHEDFVSKETYDYVLNRTKSFFSYMRHGESKTPREPTIPSVINAITTLRSSIDTWNQDPVKVITFINMTKQSLIFYVESQLRKEKDETKCIVYETFLIQNDPARKRANAIHESPGEATSEEEEEEETKDSFNVVNQEETVDKKEEVSSSSGLTDVEEEEGEEEEDNESSSDKHIL